MLRISAEVMRLLGDYIRITIEEPMGEAAHSSTAQGSGSGIRLIPGKAKELSRRGGPEKRAFVASETSLRGIVKLRVVAVISDEKEETIGYVAAPDRVMAFEPELRSLLGPYMTAPFKLACLYEKSCGAIIFRRHSGNVEFLLIKNKKGGNWGFPKGHVESGEDETDTARREVLEETGLDIQIIDGFRVVSEYRPRGKIFKQVVFFLAEMPDSGQIMIQQSEVDRHMWADYGLAMRTFRFNNDRNVLTQAKNWISKN